MCVLRTDGQLPHVGLYAAGDVLSITICEVCEHQTEGEPSILSGRVMQRADTEISWLPAGYRFQDKEEGAQSD